MKLFNLIVISIGLSNFLVQAAPSGTQKTEELQLQQALMAAPKGNDAPVDASLNSLQAIPVEFDSEPSELERAVSATLVPPTLEERLQEGISQRKLEQFGYEIFSSVAANYSVPEAMPVPENYIVGPGDSFVVQVFGAADVQYNLVVTREGRLLVPELGDLQVAGLTFIEAKTLIVESLERVRIGAKAIATIGQLRAIQVLMLGEVSRPGNFTVNGLSSLLNTLVNAGGIKRSGTLRKIQVKRAGALISEFDLYDLLLRGDESGNISLRHGDVIFVPPIGETVGIAGEVQRAAIYELKDEKTVGDIIKLAGGLLPTAALGKTQLERIATDDFYTLIETDLTSGGDSVLIKNGDLIRVLPVIEKFSNVVYLDGHVVAPGSYEWRPGMLVSTVINELGLLRQGADFDTAVIERENDLTKRNEVLYFDLRAALRGDPRADIRLTPRDRILVFSMDGNRSQQLKSIVEKFRKQAAYQLYAPVVYLNGYFKHAGSYPLEAGLRVLDVVRHAGGIQPGTDMEFAVLARTDNRTGNVDITTLKLKTAELQRYGDHNPIVLPSDRLYLFDDYIDRAKTLRAEVENLAKQASVTDIQKTVFIDGAVNHPGEYPMVAGMRIKDLIIAAGGLRENASSIFATLSRKDHQVNEFNRVNLYDVRFDISSASVFNSQSILYPGDTLRVKNKPEWVGRPNRVTIEGEVLYPGTYSVDKRETLCSLVQRVGGFTENAYLFGTVFLRESVRRKEQEALDRIMGEMDDLLAEVHMSPGFDKDKKSPTENDTAEIYKVIKSLAPKKATGRLVVDMDAAVNKCSEKEDIVLENGDRIVVPKFQDEISVVGQVYYPTSHKYRPERAALDYINLSGGTKELAQREHAFVVQANGEVMTVRSMASTWGWLMAPSNVKVTPGSTVYVPLSVDRINGRELTQSWVDLFYKLTLGAASVDFLFSK